MPRQTSIQLTPASERQLADLKGYGFGSTTDIIRVAIDRMYTQEAKAMLSYGEQHESNGAMAAAISLSNKTEFERVK